MALKREKKAQKGFVSLRNIKLSVVCSKILTTPKLNFVNRLGIKLLPGENKEEKKKKKKGRRRRRSPLPCFNTHTHAHTHHVCVLLNFIRTRAAGLLHNELQSLCATDHRMKAVSFHLNCASQQDFY